MSDEMMNGYLDGLDADNPRPSDNRSQSYIHGFNNGRDDTRSKPRAAASVLRKMANLAIIADQETIE